MFIEYFLPAASTYAKDSDSLWMLIFWFVGFWFMLAQGVFFWLMFKFKKRDGVKAQYITGELKSEKRWITIPHMLVLVCDVFIVVGAVKVWYDVKQDLPTEHAGNPAQVVRVIAQQWAWTFVHPGPDGKIDTADDIATVDELHVQVDQLYHYKLESKDVLHNFSVPVFRLKQDAIPGRVIIETPEQHAAWMASHSTGSLARAEPALIPSTASTEIAANTVAISEE